MSKKITIIALGSRGDLQPLIILGKALKQQGHQIRVFAGKNFSDWIEAEGLEAIPCDFDYEKEFQTSQGMHTIELGESHTEMLKTMQKYSQESEQGDWVELHSILSYEACIGSDAVIATHNLGMPSITEKIGAKQIDIAFFPFYSVSYAWGTPEDDQEPSDEEKAEAEKDAAALNEAINHFRKTILGLGYQSPEAYEAACRDIFQLNIFSEKLLPDTSFVNDHNHITGYIFPEDDSSWTPPPELDAFMKAGKPPISIGFGSMTMRDPEKLVNMFSDAVSEAGERAIFLSGWAKLGANMDLPDNIFCADHVPHNWLFPRCAAAIHHGGAGTFAMATKSGIPSIVVPFWFDQFFWGKRANELGIGSKPIYRKDLNKETIMQTITQTVNDPVIKSEAAKMGKIISEENGLENAVKLIEEYINN